MVGRGGRVLNVQSTRDAPAARGSRQTWLHRQSRAACRRRTQTAGSASRQTAVVGENAGHATSAHRETGQ
eukprot:289127-Chlamydomonas_euryale.AAC.1